MRRALMVLAFVAVGGISAHAQQVFIASLSGAQEVPANSSTARGTCKIILNAAETQVSVTCTYSGLSSALTAAHTHGNAAIGVNAGVLFNYAPPTGSTSGTFSAGPFNVTAQNVVDMRAHRHYSNLHTVNIPGGEIRGQIKQAHTIIDGDGDGRTDPMIFRQSTDQFWVRNSLDGSTTIKTHGTGTGDIFLNNQPADYDGDGLADLVLVKLIGTIANWNILQSSNNTVRNVNWGDFSATLGDTLAISDYDGDGAQDIAVYRRLTAEWWVIRSSDGVRTATKWGIVPVTAATGDQPSVGDYDGDGKADLTAVRTESGQRVWYTLRSRDGSSTRTVFGASATDGFFFFAPFDVDGDGKQDIAVNRAVSGQRQFHWLRSSDGAYQVFSWGLSGTSSTAIFGDFDGDGKTDLGARRVVGGNLLWEILRSSDSGISYFTYGLSTGDQLAQTDPDDYDLSRGFEMSTDQTDEEFTGK